MKPGMTRYIRSREELENLLITMHRQEWSIRALCRHFGMDRNSVRRALRGNAHRRDKGCDVLTEVRAPRKTKITPYLDLMKQILAGFPGITGVRMYEKLMDAGFDSGKTIVFDRLRQLRPKPKRKPFFNRAFVAFITHYHCRSVA